MFLARSISAQKWQSHNNIGKRQISADAVTYDMRTTDNCLSFWLCDPSSESSLEDVALALASTRESVDRLDLVWLAEEQVKGMRVRIDEVSGETPAKQLNNKHRDIAGIDVWRLARLGRGIATAVKATQWKRFTKKEVLEILLKAVKGGLIALSDLGEPLAGKIQQALANVQATKSE